MTVAATHLGYATIDELARRLKARETSSTELVEQSLVVLESVGVQHNAVASLTVDRARRAAAIADQRRATRNLETSDLLGIPFGVKDAFAASDAPTTWGSEYFRDQRFDADAATVSRLERAGAVLVAKLSMSELAGYGTPSVSGASLQGPALNPWNPKRYAGGSSGGSAIAVAIGAVPFALGTETAGSVVSPAAFCGITGLRTTPGRISTTGVLTLSRTLDKIGVMARTARDCWTVFSHLAREVRPYTTGSHLKVGMVHDEVGESYPEAATALSRAIDEFTAVFPHVITLDRSAYGDWSQPLKTIMLAEGAFAFRTQLADPAFRLSDSKQEAGLRSGTTLFAGDYLAAMRARDAARSTFRRLFSRCDLLMSVSRPFTARPLGTPRASEPQSTADRLRVAANLVGLPGVTVPCGLAADGLPVGLHIVGPLRSDERVLFAAQQYQAATAHHRRHPPGVNKRDVAR